MQLRRALVVLLLAAGVSGCSGTPFGDQLSRSFSQPPATPAAPAAKPAAATPAAKPAAQAEAPKSEPTKPAAKPTPPAPPLTPAPYRVTIKLPAADPSSPAEAVTDALRQAGVAFEVETIERVPAAGAETAAPLRTTPGPTSAMSLSRRQAHQLTDTAYLAAATALLWVGLYYLPVGGALFRLALPLPLALLQLRHNRRCAVEGVAVSALLLVALMGPVRGPLVLFPYTLLALWLGWCWTRQLSWWISWGVGVLIGATGFLVRVAVVSVLLGENLWVVITTAAAQLLERLSGLLQLGGGPDLWQVQLLALGLVLIQNVIYVLALHAVALWIFPRLRSPITPPPPLLRPLLALDPL